MVLFFNTRQPKPTNFIEHCGDVARYVSTRFPRKPQKRAAHAALKQTIKIVFQDAITSHLQQSNRMECHGHLLAMLRQLL